MAQQKHTIVLIPGDGIGPEVTGATKRVLEAAGLLVEWVELPAGTAALEQGYDNVLPQRTLAAIKAHKVALKGPVTTPVGKGFTSVNVLLRKKLNLYAAVRPVRSLPGVKTRFDNVDMIIVRENTEGLYSGIENEVVPLYYDRDEHGVPRGWVARVKRAIRTLGWRFNTDRMVMDYARECYLPSAGATSSQMPK